MKKLFSIFILFALTSCGGYESLSTPFNFRGQGINLFGSNSEPAAGGTSNTYEVVVNAPAGTPEATATALFDEEARKDCGGREFSKQITSSGTATIRQFNEKGLNQNAIETYAPTLRGYITCQDKK
jgi:hypothetical protein